MQSDGSRYGSVVVLCKPVGVVPLMASPKTAGAVKALHKAACRKRRQTMMNSVEYET